MRNGGREGKGGRRRRRREKAGERTTSDGSGMAQRGEAEGKRLWMSFWKRRSVSATTDSFYSCVCGESLTLGKKETKPRRAAADPDPNCLAARCGSCCAISETIDLGLRGLWKFLWSHMALFLCSCFIYKHTNINSATLIKWQHYNCRVYSCRLFDHFVQVQHLVAAGHHRQRNHLL